MTTLHTLGFPRIGAQRELKQAQEAFWRGESNVEALHTTARQLRQRIGYYKRGWHQTLPSVISPCTTMFSTIKYYLVHCRRVLAWMLPT